jgi:hypothetical protein
MDSHSFSYPASSTQRQLPVNLAPGDEACFAKEVARSFPRVSARLLRNACVSSEGICTVGNRFAQLPVLLTPGMPLTVRHSVKSSVMLARRALAGLRGGRSEHVRRALLLTDVHFEGFFHWFGDILPKLEALVRSCGDVREYVVLVPATRDAPYVAESLAAYGVNHRVVPQGGFVIADELCFVPRLTPTGNYRPELMCGVRDRIGGRFPATGRGMRLYVARAEAPKRRLLNEKELAPVLARHGFESVCMEKLRFAEQVKLASGSEMIVGLHGAGLTHMLWARAGTSILEIRGATETQNNCYFSLASDLGHRYYYVPARQLSVWRPSHLSDYVVDVEQVDAALAQLVTDAA